MSLDPRLRGDDEWVIIVSNYYMRTASCLAWIPACSGMTEETSHSVTYQYPHYSAVQLQLKL